MKDYIIDEIYEIELTGEKTLLVRFKLIGDNEESYRELFDNDYYNWCEDDFNNMVGDSFQYDVDDDYLYNSEDYFDIEEWIQSYSDSEIVMDYIYETYPLLSYLPDTK